MLDRNSLLAANKRRYAIIDIPGFDDGLRIQSLTEGEINDVMMKQFSTKGKRDDSKIREAKVNWIVAAAVDEHGARLFSDADVPGLLEIDGAITERAYAGIQAHVGVGGGDRGTVLKN